MLLLLQVQMKRKYSKTSGAQERLGDTYQTLCIQVLCKTEY